MLIVVYAKADGIVFNWCEYEPDTCAIESWGIETPCFTMKGVDWDKVAYGIYKWQKIDRKYDEEGHEIPWYLSELNLQPLDGPAQILPRSMHVAALTAVDGVAKRATVIRKYEGVNYTIPNCRTSQQALTAYQTGELKVYNPAYNITAPENKDCFVLVYFISETPFDTEIEIPVIVDKVVK